MTGIVHKRLFREGSGVKAGQLLFVIDSAPCQAPVDSARAVLAKAQAQAEADVAGAAAVRLRTSAATRAGSTPDSEAVKI